jgi:polyisoprenyl-phosphate glycosyltransferase
MIPTISVIIPVYNERETLEQMAARLIPVMEECTGGSFEILCIDDGSRDGSDKILDQLHEQDRRFKAIHFSRNFGKQAALHAGLEEASGKAVILIDADLQDPPEVFHKFIELWKQGYEVVYAVRTKRKEIFWKRAAYATFYRTLKMVAEIDMPLDAGDFCLMDRRVVDHLISLPERNRFLPGLRSWIGMKQIGVEFEREARYAGRPQQPLGKLVGLALSGYIGFSAVPLRLATWLGLFAASVGFLIGVWAIVTRLTGTYTGNYSPRGWASTVAPVMFIGGIQLLMLGVIGEYLSRVYDEVRQRPLYIVKSRVGLSNTEVNKSEKKEVVASPQ